jgi:glycosyltransferase involved in cell wall biosynthesis
MEEKRVLVIYGSADLYGASKNLLRSLHGFKRLGWTSITVLPHEGPLVELIQADGFEVMLLEHGVVRRQNLNPRGMLTFCKQLFSAHRQLSTLIKKEKIDIVYSNSNANIVGGLLKLTSPVKHIWHIHEIIEHPKWFKTILELFIKSTEDQVLCVSEAVRNNFSSIPLSKLQLLYNGINTKPFEEATYDLKAELGISQDKVLIGMIARVNKWKGQLYFLEIAALLQKNNPHLHFVLVGDAFEGYEYLYDELTSHIQDLGLKDVVSDLGFRKDVAEILNGLDIFVVPSILPDPLPTTVLEGMASAKPVIATNHGGAKEMVVDGETGFLIPWDCPEVAIKSIQQLIDSPELRKKMGNAGRLRVTEHFNREKYLFNFGKLISSI